MEIWKILVCTLSAIYAVKGVARRKKANPKADVKLANSAIHLNNVEPQTPMVSLYITEKHRST